MKINEGLRAGDLADIVQPLVSIDEYESKIDNDAIVIGFYVNDVEAADDLNRFIQKSAVSLIDTDVSPAPDQRGFYMVFVEILYNERMVDNIESILSEISPLVKIKKWKMSLRGVKRTCDFNKKLVDKLTKINQLKDAISDLKNEIENNKMR